jgi:integral membrane protein (TIGR01906 family)
MRVLLLLASFLFVLCLPILLLSSNLRLVVNEPRLYQYGFDKYQVSQRTGIESPQLLQAARGLIHYFNSEEELIRVRVSKEGRELELFNEREVVHLRDVKGLLQLGYRLQLATLAFVLGFGGISYLVSRPRSWRKIARVTLGGSVLTLALMLALGLGVILGFEQLFLQFHLLSFSNDLWILDPGKDYLIMMFPEGFFYDAALLIAGATVGEALLLAGISAGFLTLPGRRLGGSHLSHQSL